MSTSSSVSALERDCGELRRCRLRDLVQGHDGPVEVDVARIEPREIEELRGELLEPLHLLAHRRQELAARLLVELFGVEQLEKAAEGEHRRAELVRRVRDELTACVVELGEPASHALERAGELAHLVVAGIGHGLVEHPVRDPLRSTLEPSQATREDPRARVAHDERERERQAAGDEQATLDDAHIPEGAIERGREQQDPAVSAHGVGDLGKALAVAGNRRPARNEVP